MSVHRADASYMHLALRLAQRAMGRTSPNPMVGAILVKSGRIIGQGYHRKAGSPHAEVEALRQAGRRARGSTLYVTLEPCNHAGRTSPCCDAILAAGVTRVVAATRDPNPITNGRGFARLRRAGIDVVTGVFQAAAGRLNAPFWSVMTTGLPWVVAKIGQSLDGKIATARGEARWITSSAARRVGHHWRGRVDAVLVGINTVLQDDPLLTARGVRQRAGHPIKVIVDSRLRTPATARCLSAQPPAPTIVAATRTPEAARARLERRGAEVVTLPARRGRVPLARLFRWLARRGVQSILIEGGGEVLAGALAERLVHRVIVFIAPMLIGGRTAPTSVGGPGVARLAQAIRLDDVTHRRVGPDLCVEARVVYPRHNRSPRSTPARLSYLPGRAVHGPR